MRSEIFGGNLMPIREYSSSRRFFKFDWGKITNTSLKGYSHFQFEAIGEYSSTAKNWELSDKKIPSRRRQRDSEVGEGCKQHDALFCPKVCRHLGPWLWFVTALGPGFGLSPPWALALVCHRPGSGFSPP
jgi:hypothetical protein